MAEILQPGDVIRVKVRDDQRLDVALGVAGFAQLMRQRLGGIEIDRRHAAVKAEYPRLRVLLKIMRVAGIPQPAALPHLQQIGACREFTHPEPGAAQRHAADMRAIAHFKYGDLSHAVCLLAAAATRRSGGSLLH